MDTIFFKLVEPMGNFWQIFKMDVRFIVVAIVKRGRTLQYLVALYVSSDAGLCLNLDVVTNRNMANDTDLPPDHASSSYFGRSGDTRLSGDNRMLPYFYVVGNLDLVV